MAPKKRRGQGKREFVRSYLESNPAATGRMVNDAWKQAGNKGSISGSYFYATKGRMGLTERRHRGASAPASAKVKIAPPAAEKRKPGRPPGSSSKRNGPVSPFNGRNEAGLLRQASTRNQELAELEVDIDRLMTRIMTLADLPEVENALRRARRLLVLSGGA